MPEPARRFLGDIIFLRHGQTNYTNIFPDLTAQGKKTIHQSARKIWTIADRHRSVEIRTSPMVRAQGTATIIANAIGFKGQITIDNDLAAIGMKQIELAKAIFNEHIKAGGIRQLAIQYGIDPRFEDSSIFEPRSEVKKRFYRFLAKLIKTLLINSQTPVCCINTSHYETLYHFVEELFKLNYKKDPPLYHGEIIIISAHEIGAENTVEILISFRNKKPKKILFDYVTEQIV